MDGQIQNDPEGCKAICSLKGNKYSPNLSAWLKKQRYARLPDVVEINGIRWLVWQEENDCWASGARLGQILTRGSKAQLWAVPGIFKREEGFWEAYAEDGRCAIDTQHRTSFIGDETRWDQRKTQRRCLWCGHHTQRLKTWTERTKRSAWVNDMP